jgi:hypothetical protein
MYLSDPVGRAVFQGDVFDEVPFGKMGAGDTATSEPKWTTARVSAVPILYPCDMVGPDNVSLLKAQPIARVYDAADKGLRIPQDWAGVLGVCPLPDLRGDGRMWVADFRLITAVERSYLNPDERTRSLSEYGWAVFRQRLVAATTRGLVEIDGMLSIGRVAWAESEMEALWSASGRDRRAFHGWLDARDARLPYASRREAMDHGRIDRIRVDLDNELARLNLP